MVNVLKTTRPTHVVNWDWGAMWTAKNKMIGDSKRSSELSSRCHNCFQFVFNAKAEAKRKIKCITKQNFLLIWKLMSWKRFYCKLQSFLRSFVLKSKWNELKSKWILKRKFSHFCLCCFHFLMVFSSCWVIAGSTSLKRERNTVSFVSSLYF